MTNCTGVPRRDIPKMIKDVDPIHAPYLSVRPDFPSVGKSARRLVIVGDVHGHILELRKLLEKVQFDKTAGDHLILVGDLINKGPNSTAVVQLAMDVGADAVRGNNEDRVLLASAAMSTQQAAIASNTYQSPNATSSSVTDALIQSNINQVHDQPRRTSVSQSRISETLKDSTDFEASDIVTASLLSDTQLAWIASLPLILRIENFDRDSAPPWDSGKIFVVHAGLVPWIPLEKQSPWAVMNMRSISYPSCVQVSPLLEESSQATNEQDREPSLMSSEAHFESTFGHPMDRGSIKSVQNDFERSRESRLPLESREGEAWSFAWNTHQNSIESPSERAVVIYGHDALTNLQVEPEVEVRRLNDRPEHLVKGIRYAFGLDSGCVYGKELTALVLEVNPQTNKIDHRIESVKAQV